MGLHVAIAAGTPAFPDGSPDFDTMIDVVFILTACAMGAADT
jgi:hypothetical protein